MAVTTQADDDERKMASRCVFRPSSRRAAAGWKGRPIRKGRQRTESLLNSITQNTHGQRIGFRHQAQNAAPPLGHEAIPFLPCPSPPPPAGAGRGRRGMKALGGGLASHIASALLMRPVVRQPGISEHSGEDTFWQTGYALRVTEVDTKGRSGDNDLANNASPFPPRSS